MSIDLNLPSLLLRSKKRLATRLFPLKNHPLLRTEPEGRRVTIYKHLTPMG